MRELESKKDEARRRRRNSIIVGIILVAVMFFSVLGFGFQSSSPNKNSSKNTVVYNGFTFSNNGAGYWVLDVGEFEFLFRNTPDKTNDTSADIPKASIYTGKVLYLFSGDSEAEREIYNNFRNIYLRSQYACLDLGNNTEIETNATTDCNPEYPIKTCENNFIIIEESNTPEIKVIDNCVFIRGPRENLVSLADEFLFNTLGIK